MKGVESLLRWRLPTGGRGVRGECRPPERLWWSGELVSKVNGKARFLLLREVSEEMEGKAVLFGCVSGESGRIMNLPLEEIQPAFRGWIGEVEF